MTVSYLRTKSSKKAVCMMILRQITKMYVQCTLNHLQALKAIWAGLREAVDNLCKLYSSPSQLICNCICSLFLCLTGRQKRDTWPRHKDKDTKGVIWEGWKGI